VYIEEKRRVYGQYIRQDHPMGNTNTSCSVYIGQNDTRQVRKEQKTVVVVVRLVLLSSKLCLYAYYVFTAILYILTHHISLQSNVNGQLLYCSRKHTYIYKSASYNVQGIGCVIT